MKNGVILEKVLIDSKYTILGNYQVFEEVQ